MQLMHAARRLLAGDVWLSSNITTRCSVPCVKCSGAPCLLLLGRVSLQEKAKVQVCDECLHPTRCLPTRFCQPDQPDMMPNKVLVTRNCSQSASCDYSK